MIATNYTKIKNLMLVINFNQPTQVTETVDDVETTVQKFQPIVIQARADTLTDENAVRGIVKELNIGEPVAEELTNEELYKAVYGISEVLAKALEGVLMDGIAEDLSAVDTKGVKAVTVADIAVK